MFQSCWDVHPLLIFISLNSKRTQEAPTDVLLLVLESLNVSAFQYRRLYHAWKHIDQKNTVSMPLPLVKCIYVLLVYCINSFWSYMEGPGMAAQPPAGEERDVGRVTETKDDRPSS